MLTPEIQKKARQKRSGKIKAHTGKHKDRRRVQKDRGGFVDQYLTHGGESVEDAKARLKGAK